MIHSSTGEEWGMTRGKEGGWAQEWWNLLVGSVAESVIIPTGVRVGNIIRQGEMDGWTFNLPTN